MTNDKMKELIESWTHGFHVVVHDGAKQNMIHIDVIQRETEYRCGGFNDINSALTYTLNLVKCSVNRACVQIEYEKR
jgi:hypothetical protein